MNDRSRQISHPYDASSDRARGGSGELLRAVLWCVLVLSAIGNVVASAAAANIAVHVALGIVTAASLTGLVVAWTKARA